MAVTGRKPKEEGQKVNRNPATHDWVEVPDVPYTGDVPSIGRVPRATADWWATVSSMPHCVLWARSDWQFAVDTAQVHADFARTGRYANELRAREKVMGTTIDARRSLRIRYARPEPSEAAPEPSDFEAARRRRLLEANDE